MWQSTKSSPEKVSGTSGYNVFEKFSSYILLLQFTMSALYFVIDFSLFKLRYESPEENELLNIVLN